MPALLLAFILATFILAMVPGPTTVLVLRQAIRDGRRAALVVIAANEIGILSWALIAAFGLSALIRTSSTAYDTFRVAGAVVLVALGIHSLLSARKTDDGNGVPQPPKHSGFFSGVASILSNPKAAIFAAAFLPQFVPHKAGDTSYLLLLSAVWVIVDSTWYLTLLLLLLRADGLLQRAGFRRHSERLSGIVLIVIALSLVVTWK